MNPNTLAAALQKDPMNAELVRRLILIRRSALQAIDALAVAAQFGSRAENRVLRVSGAVAARINSGEPTRVSAPDFRALSLQQIQVAAAGLHDLLTLAGEIAAAVQPEGPNG